MGSKLASCPSCSLSFEAASFLPLSQPTHGMQAGGSQAWSPAWNCPAMKLSEMWTIDPRHREWHSGAEASGLDVSTPLGWSPQRQAGSNVMLINKASNELIRCYVHPRYPGCRVPSVPTQCHKLETHIYTQPTMKPQVQNGDQSTYRTEGSGAVLEKKIQNCCM